MIKEPILTLEDTSTTSKIMKILEVLADGKWHMLNEVQQETKITKKQLQQIMDFLGQYSFTITDETKEKARLDKKAQDFLAQTATP